MSSIVVLIFPVMTTTVMTLNNSASEPVGIKTTRSLRGHEDKKEKPPQAYFSSHSAFATPNYTRL